MTQPFEAGIVVADAEVMERFYRDALGCRPVHRSVVPREIGGPAGLGGEPRVVWLQVPAGGRIKLIRPQVAAASVPAAEPLTARRGLAYLTFHLDDIDPVVAALPAAGARPLSSPIVVRARERRISFWADPEGNVVELVDRRSN
ncbi:VOC family protein [Streptomyces sp. NPDC101152]|uniref:VOC family protein n=1 Tax=Streptomyces sp. NPDC101152 TaxID=3366116 RepID=UPI00380ECBB1